jgi:hypothetical protein
VLRAKFRYETKVFVWVTLLMVAVDGFTMVLLFFVVPPEELIFTVPLFILLTGVAILFGISPWFSAHEVHDTYIRVRQGWYYNNRVDMADIKALKHIKEGPWAIGLHFIDGRTTYVNGRTKDLILLELHDVKHRNGKRRRMTRVLFDTLDNPGFLRASGLQYQEELDQMD